VRPPPTAGAQTAVGSAQTGTTASKNPLVDVDDLDGDPFSSGGQGRELTGAERRARELSNLGGGDIQG